MVKFISCITFLFWKSPSTFNQFLYFLFSFRERRPKVMNHILGFIWHDFIIAVFAWIDTLDKSIGYRALQKNLPLSSLCGKLALFKRSWQVLRVLLQLSSLGSYLPLTKSFPMGYCTTLCLKEYQNYDKSKLKVRIFSVNSDVSI